MPCTPVLSQESEPNGWTWKQPRFRALSAGLHTVRFPVCPLLSEPFFPGRSRPSPALSCHMRLPSGSSAWQRPCSCISEVAVCLLGAGDSESRDLFSRQSSCRKRNCHPELGCNELTPERTFNLHGRHTANNGNQK